MAFFGVRGNVWTTHLRVGTLDDSQVTTVESVRPDRPIT